ncbi:autophagy-related protein 13-domain-containing protein, partial [Lineolata rhizophorae]
MAKLNQVIQQFFTKSALTIVSSRVALPRSRNSYGEVRVNKWFNLILDETDVLAPSLLPWKAPVSVVDIHPPPMTIEIFIDTADLNNNQTLLTAASPNGSPAPGRPPTKPTQIVLERWDVAVGQPPPGADPRDSLADLANVYKKAVVLFRSLYLFPRQLPAWRLFRQNSRQTAGPALELKWRILPADEADSLRDIDTLDVPLHPPPPPPPPSGGLAGSIAAVTERFAFEPSASPIGPLKVAVTYRVNCAFRIEDSEALLSSRFMGLDGADQYFQPSLKGRRAADFGEPEASQYHHHHHHPHHHHDAATTQRDNQQVPGSLPVRPGFESDQPQADIATAYGSMSTF